MKPQNLTIEINNFDHEAMINAPEIAAAVILEQVAVGLRSGGRRLTDRSEAALKDLNGNTVGRLLINSPEPEPQPVGELLAAVCNLIYEEDSILREITEQEIIPETLKLLYYGLCWQTMKESASNLAALYEEAFEQLEHMEQCEKLNKRERNSNNE